jgi:DNA-binding NarL/FixJ family response regulator
VSAESDPALVGEALAAGADGHLSKPFSREAILAKVRALGLGTAP